MRPSYKCWLTAIHVTLELTNSYMNKSVYSVIAKQDIMIKLDKIRILSFIYNVFSFINYNFCYDNNL